MTSPLLDEDLYANDDVAKSFMHVMLNTIP
jgi:hypothetical protein